MDRIRIVGEAIRRRAQVYNDISDSQIASWKNRMAAEDEMQRRTINTIREVEDYPSHDGGRVKLPSHYEYVYGDGKGNYLLTNTTNVQLQPIASVYESNPGSSSNGKLSSASIEPRFERANSQ